MSEQSGSCPSGEKTTGKDASEDSVSVSAAISASVPGQATVLTAAATHQSTGAHTSALQYNSIAAPGASAFPLVNSSLLVNPAAAVAAVAAKQLAQQQGQHPQNLIAAATQKMQSTNGHGHGHSHSRAGSSGIFHGRQQPASASVNGSTDPISSITQAALSQAHATNGSAPGNVPAHIVASLIQNAASTQHQHPALSMHNHGQASSTPSQAQFPFSSPLQVVAAHPHPLAGAMTSALLPSMQNWSLEQLEQHVNLLQQMNQPVPQSVALLLADARRKEEKKTAKRVANRKSACTSRARKKALVEEMTRTNARLRRQALILALIPDLVMTISEAGEITFCSAQVQRVLQHKIDDLIGASIYDILTPASRDALRDLMKELVESDKSATTGLADNERGTKRSRDRIERRRPNGNGSNVGKSAADAVVQEMGHGNGSAITSSGSGGEVSSGAAVLVSDQSSFPLSVVKVESKQDAVIDENDTSDASAGGKQQAVSSLTNSTNSGSDDGAGDSRNKAHKKEASANASNGSKNENSVSTSASKVPRLSSSDESSTETKNLRKANENLDRNVRWHNKKLQSMSKSAKSKPGHKDDVTGASVTANNASARLSSLKHVPDMEQSEAKNKIKSSRYESMGDHSSSEDSLLAGIEEKKKVPKNVNSENASDDSGYRESNDSREETSSSASDSLNSNGRQKPLAPTCNVCLIRNNLTTLWCEVTSSIRTRSGEGDDSEDLAGGIQNKVQPNKNGPRSSTGSKASKGSTTASDDTSTPKEKVKELLLCLRPIRDGDEKVDESLRFAPKEEKKVETIASKVMTSKGVRTTQTTTTTAVVSNNSSSSGGPSNEDCIPSNLEPSKPPKKRAFQDPKMQTSKRMRIIGNDAPVQDSDTEKSVVESLMLMSNKSKQSS